MTLIVGRMDSFTLGSTRIPVESSIGIIDGAVRELTFKGSTFQQIDHCSDWLNVITGDIVKIDFAVEI